MANTISSTEDIDAFIRKVKTFLENEADLKPREYEALHKEFDEVVTYLERKLTSQED